MLINRNNPWIAIVLACLPGVVPMVAVDAAASTVDHRGKELAVAGPVLTPISHEKYYRAESDLFGYNPRYFPKKMGTRGFFSVSFGSDNRPYIWTGSSLTTLSGEGVWIALETTKTLTKTHDLDPENGHVAARESLRFDAAGNAYMIARLGPYKAQPELFRYGLLYSTDQCRTWTFHQTPN